MSSNEDEAHESLVSEIRKLNSSDRKKSKRAQIKNVRITRESEIPSHKLGNILKKIGDHSQNKYRSKPLIQPLDKPKAKRLQREAGYEHVTVEANKWDGIVEERRRADQLHFPLEKVDLRVITSERNYKPPIKTSLEKEVYGLLHGADLLKEEKKETEEEKEIKKAMSLKEIRERTRQIMRNRNLKMRLERKSFLLNKSKSRKHHKILRRERLKRKKQDFENMKATNPEGALEVLNEIEKTRVKERMDLRHRNSNWLRLQKARAPHDDQVRDMLKENSEMRQELLEKLKLQQEKDDEEEEEEEENYDDDEERARQMKIMREQAQAIKDGKFDPENAWVSHLAVTETSSKPDESFYKFKKYWENVQEQKLKEIEAMKVVEEYEKKQQEVRSEDKGTNKLEEIDENEKDSGEEDDEEHSEPEEEGEKEELPEDREYLEGEEREKELDKEDPKNKTCEKDKSDTEISSKKIKKEAKQKSIKSEKVKNLKTKSTEISKKQTEGEKLCKKKKRENKIEKGKKKEKSGKLKKKPNDVEKEDEKKDKIGKLKKKTNDAEKEDVNKDNKNEQSKNEKKMDLQKENEIMIKEARRHQVTMKNGSKMSQKDEKTKLNEETGKMEISNFTKIADRKLGGARHDLKFLRRRLNGDQSESEEEDEGFEDIFSNEDYLQEFQEERKAHEEETKLKDIDNFRPGWGSWGGPGIVPSEAKRKRFRIKAPKKAPNKYSTIGNVIYREKSDMHQNLRKAMVSELPFPFTTVKDFEASIRQPIGRSFVPELSHKKLIAPPVVQRMGKVIEPMDEECLIKKHEAFKRKETDLEKELEGKIRDAHGNKRKRTEFLEKERKRRTANKKKKKKKSKKAKPLLFI